GMVVRHSAGAVSGLLVWWLVVEGLVVSFAPAGLVRFVPFDAGARTLDIATDLDRPEVVAAALPNPLHALIFWSYVAAAVALGAVMLRRRDVDRGDRRPTVARVSTEQRTRPYFGDAPQRGVRDRRGRREGPDDRAALVPGG